MPFRLKIKLGIIYCYSVEKWKKLFPIITLKNILDYFHQNNNYEIIVDNFIILCYNVFVNEGKEKLPMQNEKKFI